ncbi:hypothetical protein WJX74_011011 [Apatococcus lobatus]|uniref:Mitogen-activated protein kinase n=1 Tax=Apatococcus lobatus TaxID=904363 RepID=A0AAW1QNB1_9CHLO
MSSRAVPSQARVECEVPGKQAYMLWKTRFEIDEHYVPVKAVGKGASGVVISAKDTRTGEKVAIKKLGNAFEHTANCRQTLREMKLLRHLQHDNIVGLKDVMRPASQADFKDMYLVHDLMDTDLHQIIRTSQPLTDEHFQYFIYQVLRGLKFIHTAGVLHRDLKPSNLLLNASCDLKIADFGLARHSSGNQNFMTEYVVTRWYRAPELLLANETYSGAIDIWSVGCILAEVLQRTPLFPGADYLDQLKRIIKVLGSPSDAELTFIQHPRARSYLNQLPASNRVDFQTLYPSASPLAIDLLDQMLQFDPRRRISVEAALAHPYLAALHDQHAEPVCSEPFSMGCDETVLKAAELKEEVWKEVLIYHPDPPAEDYEDQPDPAGYQTLDATNPFNDSAYLLDGHLSAATHRHADGLPTNRTHHPHANTASHPRDEQQPLGPGFDSSAGSPTQGLTESPNGVPPERRNSPIKVEGKGLSAHHPSSGQYHRDSHTSPRSAGVQHGNENGAPLEREALMGGAVGRKPPRSAASRMLSGLGYGSSRSKEVSRRQATTAR